MLIQMEEAMGKAGLTIRTDQESHLRGMALEMLL